jgi:hypothetical protein
MTPVQIGFSSQTRLILTESMRFGPESTPSCLVLERYEPTIRGWSFETGSGGRHG